MQLREYLALRRYVEFTAEDEARIHAALPLLIPCFPTIIDDFFLAIGQHPEASQVLSGGAEQIERLKKTLGNWLLQVLSGPYDERYLEAHARIGRRHVEIALPQSFMVTAMNRIRARLVEVLELTMSPALSNATRLSMHRVLDLELTLMLDTYRQDLLTKARDAERRALTEAVPAYVIAVNAEDEIVLWNDRLAHITGFSADEMRGSSGSELLGDGDDRRLAQRDGGHRLVRWQRSEGTQSSLIYAVGVDVTEERELERRTRRAERLSAAGTLAAGLAHEVRNPLNAALLQVQVLQRRIERGTTEAEELLPVLDVVKSEISRLEHLVQDFLAFARPRPLTLHAQPIDAELTKVAELLGPEARERGVELELRLEARTTQVEIEVERFRQVLLNLARNAIEAMDGGGHLQLISRAPDEQGYVTMEIQDDGPGFPDDAPIFDAFFTTKPSGTGLGLSIAHSIIQEHGGQLSASSRPGRTVFTIRLPEAMGSAPSASLRRLTPTHTKLGGSA